MCLDDCLHSASPVNSQPDHNPGLVDRRDSRLRTFRADSGIVRKNDVQLPASMKSYFQDATSFFENMLLMSSQQLNYSIDLVVFEFDQCALL